MPTGRTNNMSGLDDNDVLAMSLGGSAFSVHTPCTNGKRVSTKRDINSTAKFTGVAQLSEERRKKTTARINKTPSRTCSFLKGLPNRGFVKKIRVCTPENAYNSRKPNVRGTECLQVSMPSVLQTGEAKASYQIIKTDETNVLVRSLQMKKAAELRRAEEAKRMKEENEKRLSIRRRFKIIEEKSLNRNQSETPCKENESINIYQTPANQKTESRIRNEPQQRLGHSRESPTEEERQRFLFYLELERSELLLLHLVSF
mmetsp:Transcript_9302/g.12148  ORF Transcript_9302/g.12148 Transcript_9302/m.12148 type:complete len:258 (+) Transcript_9302:127-900(+)